MKGGGLSRGNLLQFCLWLVGGVEFVTAATQRKKRSASDEMKSRGGKNGTGAQEPVNNSLGCAVS